ncbi:MAG: LamG-like jellyroll fold domain-containing protein, partial [Catenulispora sp.]
LRFAGPAPEAEFRALPGVSEVVADDRTLRMRVSGPITPVVRAAAGHELLDFVSREPTLEETFLAEYGHETRGGPGVNGNGTQAIVSKQTGSWMLGFNSANQLILRQEGSANLAWSWNRVTDTSAWHYVAVTKNGSAIHLYIDGVDVTGAVASQTLSDNTLPLVIGQSVGGSYFHGQVQEVALYNQALSASQVAGHYQAGSGQPPASTAGGTGATLGTIGTVGPGDPTVAAAGDIACDPTSADFNAAAGDAVGCQQAATAQLMSGNQLMGQPLSAVLTLGDNVYEDGTAAAFSASYNPTWGLYRNITYPVPGNHDYHTAAGIDYYDYYNGAGALSGRAGNEGAGYYSFNVGSWHVIALNSNCTELPGGCGLGSPQEQWLAQDLANDRAACTLAYWHHPLFHSGGEGGGELTQQMFTDLYNAHATLVVNGHEHQYERFAPQDPIGHPDPVHGIAEVIAGTGGKDLEDFGPTAPNSVAQNDTTFGVLSLGLHAASYDFQFVPAAGGTFTDSGSGQCRNIPPSVTTAVAQPVSFSGATLNGSVNPNGQATSVYFQYGLDSGYGTSTPSQDAGSGGDQQPMSAAVTGLMPRTMYHYRMVATSAAGTTYGPDQAFTTAPAPDTTAPAASASSPAYAAGVVWRVAYSATDNAGGDGVAAVDLYAQGPNDAGYSKVASDSSGSGAGSFTYTAGEGDGSYRFYAVATDQAGNAQATPSSPQTTTRLDSTPPTSSASAPAAASPGATISVPYTASDGSGSGIAEVDLYAQAPGQTSYSAVAVDTSGSPSGSFSYTLNGGPGTYNFYTTAFDTAGNVEATPAVPDSSTKALGAPATVSVVSGSSQSATVGTAFGMGLVALVTDSAGDPVPGAAVTFTAPSSGASGTFATGTATTTVITDANGQAAAGAFAANTTGGAYTVSASTSGAPATSFSLTNAAGSPAALVFVRQPADSTGGVAFGTQPQVAVQDQYGNTVSTDASAVRLAISSGTGTSGAALACTGDPVTAAGGVANFSGCDIDKSGSGYTLTATDGALSPATSAPLNIAVGPAAKLVFTQQPGGAQAGLAFASQPQVTVEDAGGNVVSGYGGTVSLAVSGGTGTSGAALRCSANPAPAGGGVVAF